MPMIFFRHNLATWTKGVANTLFKPILHHQVKLSIKTAPEMAPSPAKRIVWVDLEMTGLNVEVDQILEIACLVTDADLNIVATGPNIIIHHPEEILSNMNQWCITQHGELCGGLDAADEIESRLYTTAFLDEYCLPTNKLKIKSGLTDACRESNVSVTEAENQILAFVKAHVPENKCSLGGNSVYMDRLFIQKYMPKLNNYLHYRIIDVSTIKELARRWYPKEYSRQPRKKFEHRCLSDIIESIEELKYYKQHIFKTVS